MMGQRMMAKQFRALPVAERQLVTFVRDADLDSMGRLRPQPVNSLKDALKTLSNAITGNPDVDQREFGIRRVPQSWATVLAFPPGHPQTRRLYAAHPVIETRYLPVGDFHRYVFDHKFAELMHILVSLGATRLEIEHIEGFDREMAAQLKGSGLFHKGEPNSKRRTSRSQTCFSAQRWQA